MHQLISFNSFRYRAKALLSSDLEVSAWIQSGIKQFGDHYSNTYLLFKSFNKSSTFTVMTFSSISVSDPYSRASWIRTMTFFKEVIHFYNSPAATQKGIFHLYRLLLTQVAKSKSSSMSYWERTLHFSIPLCWWHITLQLPPKLSKCISHWESFHKIIHKWYYTPTKLASIFPDQSPHCWRLCGQSGSLYHIWWYCPKISSYWSKIANFISSVSSHTLSLTPQMVLLGNAILDLCPRLRFFISHTLIAVRLVHAPH